MADFLTPGKEQCRRLWYQHAYGPILLLSAEDMSDALQLAEKSQMITCPEKDHRALWNKCRALGTGHGQIQIKLGDYTEFIASHICTYIPDLMVGWCDYTQQLIKKICERASDVVTAPTVLFLTLTKYQPVVAQYGTTEERRLYMSQRRMLSTVKPELEQLISSCGCFCVPIENSIFEYCGTPQRGKALKGPNMLHFGYKIFKLDKETR